MQGVYIQIRLPVSARADRYPVAIVIVLDSGKSWYMK
jgi:hypothetical protein